MLNALLLTVLAGLSTTIGSLIIFFVRKRRDGFLNMSLGFSAGVMIFVSFVELLNESIENLGFLYAILGFFLGIFIIYLIDVLIPHSYEEECACDPNLKKECDLKRCSIMVAVGIAIHNFPEGIAVFFSALVDIKLGIAVALAIALHNIPEGIAVAMPMYYATNSRLKAFFYSFISGVAEPVGAIVAYLFLYNFINITILNVIIAAVAGIMIYISFDELLPQAYKEENNHKIIFGIFAGMAVMALSLYLI